LEKAEVRLVEFIVKEKGCYFVDFGKDAFATLKLSVTSPQNGHIMEVNFGETVQDKQTIYRNPKGCVRYRKMLLELKKGTHEYIVEITPDERNSSDQAILMPPEIGKVMPFRYCELANEISVDNDKVSYFKGMN